MTREEKQKAIDALKKSAPLMAVTQEEFKDYIQTLNKIMDWLEKEPTTKNDLGIDCINRDSAIKALDYDMCFEFKRGINRHMDDIAKLLNTIYETQVNNIKVLSSVTPKGYLSIDDVMSVFDDFMRGEVDEDETSTFLEMLRDKAESEGQ